MARLQLLDLEARQTHAFPERTRFKLRTNTSEPKVVITRKRRRLYGSLFPDNMHRLVDTSALAGV